LILAPSLDLLAALVAYVPFEDLGVLGRPLAWLAGSVLRIRRGHVENAMTHARLKGPAEEAWRFYSSLGQGVMELLWLAGGAGGVSRDLSRVALVDPSSRSLLEQALRSRHGVVLAASHTGNWELAACALAARAPLSVLVKPVSLGVLDAFMSRLRGRYGVGTLSGEGALALARAELEAGRVVAVLLDQVPAREEHGDWLPFLSRDALTDRAAAALAASQGCPLVVTASRRADGGRHWLHVLSVKHPPLRGRSAWARQATREATRELEAFVLRYPDQWLWLHRRWKLLGRQVAHVQHVEKTTPA
jgi:KDO2-lipid IV(A) lauroyltransferase